MKTFLFVLIVLSASLLGGYLSPLVGITSFFFLTVLLFFFVGADIKIRMDEQASLLFAFFGAASVLYAGDKWGAIIFSASFIAGALFYVVLRNSSGWAPLLLQLLVLGGCINGIAEAVRQAHLMPYGLFYNPNPFSGFLTPLVPISLYLYSLEKKKRYLIASGLLIFANFISASRMGVFTMLLALALILLYCLRTDRAAAKAVLLVFLAGFCSFLVFSGVKEFILLQGGAAILEKPSHGITGRTHILKITLQLIGQAPFLGHGLNSFKGIMGSLANPYVVITAIHAHSLYLNILVELGIVGLGLFLLFVALVMRGPFSSLPLLKIGLASFLFHNIVEYNFPAPAFQVLFYLLCAAIMNGKEPEPGLFRVKGRAAKILPVAIALYFLVVNLFPVVGLSLLGRAEAAFQERDIEKTLKYLSASTYFGYSVSLVHERRAAFATLVYFSSNEKDPALLDLAEKNYLKAMALNSMDGELYVKVADFYFRVGRPAQSEAYLQKVIEKYPYYQQYRLVLARFYVRQKRYSEAIQTLEASDRFLKEFAPISPVRVGILSDLAAAYREQGDVERAERVTGEARSLSDRINSSIDKGEQRP